MSYLQRQAHHANEIPFEKLQYIIRRKIVDCLAHFEALHDDTSKHH